MGQTVGHSCMNGADCTERMSAADYRAALSAPSKRPGGNRSRPARRQPEFDEQVLFFILLDHLAAAHPERTDELRDIWASANGGLRLPRTSGRLRAAGARKGVPDIEVMVPCQGFHGMFVEMKAPGSGRPTAEQKARIARLNGRGYRAVVAFGWIEAGQKLCEYLGLAWEDRWLVAVPEDRASRRGRGWLTGPLQN